MLHFKLVAEDSRIGSGRQWFVKSGNTDVHCPDKSILAREGGYNSASHPLGGKGAAICEEN